MAPKKAADLWGGFSRATTLEAVRCIEPAAPTVTPQGLQSPPINRTTPLRPPRARPLFLLTADTRQKAQVPTLFRGGDVCGAPTVAFVLPQRAAPTIAPPPPNAPVTAAQHITRGWATAFFRFTHRTPPCRPSESSFFRIPCCDFAHLVGRTRRWPPRPGPDDKSRA